MIGKTIYGYTLQRLLGVGGMAEVWLAENEIGKLAAVKLLLPKFCHDEDIVTRFKNEAKVMVKLDHPNIRQVYDYGEIDGRPGIVMEYLEGDDLKALLKSGKRFSNEELRRWWNQIADALNYTHAQGIVHRDIKPSNIFLDKKGNIKLLDFGIAKIKEGISMTQTGAMMGTLIYMSPEQVDDAKHLGPASDVYSLAVSFVHLLTGKAPYDTTTMSDFKIREAIVYKPLDMTGVPKEWQVFLIHYLEKDPEKRPALRAFDSKLKETPVELNNDAFSIVAPADESTVVLQKPKVRKGLWIGIGVAVVAVVVALVMLFPHNKFKQVDEQLRKASEIYAEYHIKGPMDDYSQSITHLNEGYSCCINAVDLLAEVEVLNSDDCMHLDDSKMLSDSLAWLYVNNVDDILKLELESLTPECDTVSAVRRIRQLDGFLPLIEDAVKLEKKIKMKRGVDLVLTVNDVTFVMKCVPGGTFLMGAQNNVVYEQNFDSDAYSSENPVHSVTLDTYYMGETEVTQALWKAVMGSEPTFNDGWTEQYGKGNDYPAYRVSWDDIQEFLQKLNRLTGEDFRLPTEAEWEYAARGGQKSNGYKYAGDKGIGDVAWYTNSSGNMTHPVKGKKANELGLYDMSGNVWEWCGDLYDEYGSSALTNPNPQSTGMGFSYRVLRGGGWINTPSGCRVSVRGSRNPNDRSFDSGFRLVLPQ